MIIILIVIIFMQIWNCIRDYWKATHAKENLNGHMEVFFPLVGLTYNEALTLPFRIATNSSTSVAELWAPNCHDSANLSYL